MDYGTAIVVDDSSRYRSCAYGKTISRPVPTRIRSNPKSAALTPKYQEIAQEDANMFKQQIAYLIERWTNEVEDISSFSDMVSHRDYKTVYAKGRRAIPILLNELRYRPHFWFDALQILVKANYGIDVDPVNEEDRGDLLKMANAWIVWGEQNDFI